MNQPALSVLIPAAGASKRLGRTKQLVKYKGSTLIQNAINIATSIAPLEIIVVTGANAEAIRASVQNPQAHWVHNPGWPAGMGGSIAIGASAISTKSSGLMIYLCDQYRIDSNDLQTLLKTWQSNPGRIVAAEAEGRLMPPVILPSGCFGALQNLQGDQGARQILESRPELLTPVTLQNAAFDLDTLSHLEMLETSQNP